MTMPWPSIAQLHSRSGCETAPTAALLKIEIDKYRAGMHGESFAAVVGAYRYGIALANAAM